VEVPTVMPNIFMYFLEPYLMDIQNASYSDGRLEINGGIKGALCIFLLRMFKVITVKLATLLQANFDASASKSSRFTVSFSIASK
jgi:hypothetical protein